MGLWPLWPDGVPALPAGAPSWALRGQCHHPCPVRGKVRPRRRRPRARGRGAPVRPGVLAPRPAPGPSRTPAGVPVPEASGCVPGLEAAAPEGTADIPSCGVCPRPGAVKTGTLSCKRSLLWGAGPCGRRGPGAPRALTKAPSVKPTLCRGPGRSCPSNWFRTRGRVGGGWLGRRWRELQRVQNFSRKTRNPIPCEWPGLHPALGRPGSPVRGRTGPHLGAEGGGGRPRPPAALIPWEAGASSRSPPPRPHGGPWAPGVSSGRKLELGALGSRRAEGARRSWGAPVMATWRPWGCGRPGLCRLCEPAGSGSGSVCFPGVSCFQAVKLCEASWDVGAGLSAAFWGVSAGSPLRAPESTPSA